MIHIHIDKVENLTGFTVTNVKPQNYFWLLVRSTVTSDEPIFYKYMEQISNIFLSRAGIFVNAVSQFLVLIHKDLSGDLYVNDLQVAVEVRAKRDLQKGELIRQDDIADIRRLTFPDIEIAQTDKVIYCCKVGWKFGLFFDLARPDNFDIDKMALTLGELYRYLSFQHVYDSLKNEPLFDEMLNGGWFPFVEIVAREYKALSEAYESKFDFENRIENIVKGFDKARIEKIINKWWGNQIFKDKQSLIEAGVNAFLQGTNGGFINCIKNLPTEIEGVLRSKYSEDPSKDKSIKIPELLNHIIEMGKTKSGSDYSLILPLPFLKYLKDVIFASFDLEGDKIPLSRNSSSHGVAKPQDYTKIRALQSILALDQIYFYG